MFPFLVYSVPAFACMRIVSVERPAVVVGKTPPLFMEARKVDFLFSAAVVGVIIAHLSASFFWRNTASSWLGLTLGFFARVRRKAEAGSSRSRLGSSVSSLHTHTLHEAEYKAPGAACSVLAQTGRLKEEKEHGVRSVFSRHVDTKVAWRAVGRGQHVSRNGRRREETCRRLSGRLDSVLSYRMATAFPRKEIAQRLAEMEICRRIDSCWGERGGALFQPRVSRTGRVRSVVRAVRGHSQRICGIGGPAAAFAQRDS